MSPVNYRLELPTQWSIHDVFHTDLLTPYRETPTHGANYQCPPPDLMDGVEEYEVKKVLDSRRYRRGRKLENDRGNPGVEKGLPLPLPPQNPYPHRG
jgi:hypothetical protein